MPENNKAALFYEHGLKFECQGSGKCCTSRGEFGFVFLSKEDQKRLADHLNLSIRDFQKKYCAQTQGIWHLKEDKKENQNQADCLFLKEKRCAVYEARPNQCRTWPFWPEVMNAKAWKVEVASFCPGVGKGKVWSKAEIETVMKLDIENERQLLNDKQNCFIKNAQ